MKDFWLPQDLRQRVDDELNRGERILWMAQPSSRLFPWVSLLAFFFGIPWTLFTLFWIAGASGVFHPFDGFQGFEELQPARLAFASFGIPFLLVGVAMLTAPFWISRRAKRSAERTVYVITDNRAIIFDAGFVGGPLGGLVSGLSPFRRGELRIRSFKPEQLKNLRRVEREDGSGDIILETITVTDTHGRILTTSLGFFSIPNVKDVEDMLEELATKTNDNEA